MKVKVYMLWNKSFYKTLHFSFFIFCKSVCCRDCRVMLTCPNGEDVGRVG